jgi:protein AATF/BFR2
LDARIRLQKAFSASNRLPTAANIPTFTSQPSVRDALDKMLVEAMHLSDELFLIQEVSHVYLYVLVPFILHSPQDLIEKNEDIQPPTRKRRRIDITPDHSTAVFEGTRCLAQLESV